MKTKEACEMINRKHNKKVCGSITEFETSKARLQFLSELKGDLLEWLIFDPVEQEKALEVLKSLEKYINYLK